jgi:Activator of Hsp90 ATPase homolog 1-like protein
MAGDFEPIVLEYTLRCSAAHAFTTYTARIGDWWDPVYTARPDTLESVTLEPEVGGRMYATHSDLGQVDWGEVTVWEPGRRLVHTFTLAQDPEHPSEVAVDFAPAGGENDGSTLRLAHGGWTDENVASRKKFGDWPVLLERFVALADADEPR